MAGTVGQRQAGDRAAGLWVLVGRAVPLPVVADDQALRTRRHGRGLLVEHLEDVHAPPLGLVLLARRRNGGDTSRGSSPWPSDRPRACRAPRRSRRDSSRPPPSRRPRRATGPGGRCSSRRSRPRRRPSSPPGRASPGRRRCPPGRPGCPPAGPARRAAGPLRRPSPLPSGTIRAGHFSSRSVKPDRSQQADRPAAVGSRVVPFDRDVIERERPFAGQPIHHPVGALDDPGGAVVDSRLVPLEPERFGEHPLGRNPAGDVPQDRIAGAR